MDHLKSEINQPLVKQKKSFQEVLREGQWGPPLSSPVWTTTSETFGTQSKSMGDHKPLYQPASPPPAQLDDDLNVLYVADSIGSHCDFQSIKDATGADIVTKKAYSSVKDNRSLYPETNFQDVVPVQLARGMYNHLVMQAPSVDITNLKKLVNKTSKLYLKQEVSTSSFNMIKTAESALQMHPNLQAVVITERAPRHDNMQELSQFSNQELHRHLANSLYKDKIKVGLHSLDFEGEERDLVYGSKSTNTKPDGYHLRGPKGKQSFTKSLLNIFNKVGLTKKDHHPSIKEANVEQVVKEAPVQQVANEVHVQKEVKKPHVQQVVQKIPISFNLVSKVDSVRQVGQIKPTLVKVRSPNTSVHTIHKVKYKKINQ